MPPSAYAHVQELLSTDTCVVLDGGVATQIERLRPREPGAAGEALWGTWALYRDPDVVYDVHRSYVAAGCDVISTDTWSILEASERAPASATDASWLDITRLGVGLGREAVRDAGREGACAVALTVSGEIGSPRRMESAALLARSIRDEPPDLILLETLSLIREEITYPTVELLVGTGVPVWLSFRRCRHGVCGVYGQHWGGPEGDAFGRAAKRFEELGVRALLINCLPVDHVPGMLPWLRDFTDLPLGVYPNLGHLAGRAWRFDERVDPDGYAALATVWRQEEGAQIIGGCCGVGPEHIAAMAQRVHELPRGMRRRAPVVHPGRRLAEPPPPAPAYDDPLVDEAGRPAFPLPFPTLVCDPGVFVPTQGSFLLWRHLFREGIGRGRRCLDVGCGCGILAVQLALNEAARVTAIDVDRAAVANTAANAFRNGVAELVAPEEVDLFGWQPQATWEVVAASLYQMPVDPFEEYSGHRPLDFWGRILLDHFLGILPSILAPDGVAYVMQLSIVGYQQTAALLARAGLTAQAVDFAFFPFGPLFQQNKAQIDRVESLSDAYHLTLGGEDTMVAYLIEVRWADRPGDR